MTNQEYWAFKSQDYPHHVRQQRDENATGTRPEHLATNRHGAFLRVPLDTEILWGFSSDLHAQRFIDDFGGARL